MLTFWDPSSLPYAIDWSAWATLIVGIAAVVGAVVVGRRQANIADRQAEIAHQQASIMERQTQIAAQQAATEQTRLRAELYDRRVVIYAGIEQYLTEAISNDGKVSNEIRDSLFKSMSVARFMLGEDVEQICRDLHRTAVFLRGDVGRLERLKDDEDAKRPGFFDKIEAHNDQLVDLDRRLRATMERYLRLSQAEAGGDDETSSESQ